MSETCPCCGADMCGSDHCPCCGCEEFEGHCDRTCPDPGAGMMAHIDDH